MARSLPATCSPAHASSLRSQLDHDGYASGQVEVVIHKRILIDSRDRRCFPNCATPSGARRERCHDNERYSSRAADADMRQSESFVSVVRRPSRANSIYTLE